MSSMFTLAGQYNKSHWIGASHTILCHWTNSRACL